MLHPALMGVDLLKFPLLHTEDVLLVVKEDGTAAGRSLIQRENVLGLAHIDSPFSGTITDKKRA